MEKSQPENFQKILVDGVGRFGKTSARIMKDLFGMEFQEGASHMGPTGIDGASRMFISVLFTGTIYGEYILALDEKVAAKIVGHDLNGKSEKEIMALRVEIGQAFAEVLNIAVGECITDLGNVYEKLTITSPRVLWGHMAYPRVHNSRMQLECTHGSLEVFLYVDRMKLDVASSYRDALDSLGLAHSELQNAMRRLQDQQTVLVQTEKMASLGVMAAGIAHEINTPLATISLVSEQLKDAFAEPESTSSLNHMLDVIEKTVFHISQITNGLRMFSRGGQNEPMATHPFSEVIKNSMLLCKTYLSDKQVKLVVGEVPPSLTCECRVSQIAQVMLNLVRNASDAIEKLDSKWIKIDVEEIDSRIEIRVTDSGRGIPEALRAKIFDPFFSTKDIGKGTGLGLSISQGLLRDHGGEILIDVGNPNTCFVIRLPQKQKMKLAV